MSKGPLIFPFTEVAPQLGEAGWAPMLPFELAIQDRVAVVGLLDSGATTNVLPFSVGKQLGAEWDKQRIDIDLTGNLAGIPAKGLLATATVAGLPPVRLAFAWSQSDDVPLLLGRVNFFQAFDVCFFGNRWQFEIRPKSD